VGSGQWKTQKRPPTAVGGGDGFNRHQAILPCSFLLAHLRRRTNGNVIPRSLLLGDRLLLVVAGHRNSVPTTSIIAKPAASLIDSCRADWQRWSRSMKGEGGRFGDRCNRKVVEPHWGRVVQYNTYLSQRSRYAHVCEAGLCLPVLQVQIESSSRDRNGKIIEGI
jgi:hypothetical protein